MRRASHRPGGVDSSAIAAMKVASKWPFETRVASAAQANRALILSSIR
jgi:hypothetical protein